MTLDSLGQALESLGQREEALATYRLSIESQCSALARNPRRATFWQSLKECFGHLTSAAEGEELSPEEAELFYEVARDLASCIAATAGFETDFAKTARAGLRWTSDRAMSPSGSPLPADSGMWSDSGRIRRWIPCGRGRTSRICSSNSSLRPVSKLAERAPPTPVDAQHRLR